MTVRGSQTDELKRHLECRGRDYFPDFVDEVVHVDLRRCSQRINSTLYDFRLTCGTARHNVLVKIPFALKRATAVGDADSRAEDLRAEDRPRLSPKPSTQHKCEHEYLSLSMIARQVVDAGDERFSAVRTLDYLPEHSVLVMERIDAGSLSRLLLRASRLQPGSSSDQSRFDCRHAGAWLRFFHALPNLPHTQTRSATRDDFIASIEQFTDYLGKTESRAFFASIKQELIPRAESTLPEYIPLGLAHGDYAPRNVLVDGDSRVSIIDTLCRWQAPIFEDLSRFLCALHVSVPQIWLQGCAYSRSVLYDLELNFLEGYFVTDVIPYEQIRLFECQALLDRWASFVHSCRSSRGIRHWAKTGRRWWWRRYFSQHMLHTIRQIGLHFDRHSMLETAI